FRYLLGNTSSLVITGSSLLRAAYKGIAKVRGSGSDLNKLDSAPKHAAVSTPSHGDPNSVSVRRWPWLPIKTVAGGNETDFDHRSAPRRTRTQTGAVGMPKRAITAQRKFAVS